METMNAAWTAASEEMYKATQEAGAQQPQDGGAEQPQGNSSANTDHVEDAQFEEVK